jgi:hypothetical protein
MKPKRQYKADNYEPKGYDACQTPPHAINPLVKYIPENSIVWEPAAGEGIMARALNDCGFAVTYSDILVGQNFFEYEPEIWDCVVTNPPYSGKYDWLKRCYHLGKPFALLLPLETLGAKSGQVFFKEYGLELIVLDRRINFKMPDKGWNGSGAQFPVAWFTWGFEIGSPMVFENVGGQLSF